MGYPGPHGRYETKDSGERANLPGGMVRDTEAGKARFDLLLVPGLPYEEQPLTQHAELMARGAEKYDAHNWLKGVGLYPETEDEVEQRFISSLLRHAIQLACGADDEDHASAVMFNATGLKLRRKVLARQREEGREIFHSMCCESCSDECPAPSTATVRKVEYVVPITQADVEDAASMAEFEADLLDRALVDVGYVKDYREILDGKRRVFDDGTGSFSIWTETAPGSGWFLSGSPYTEVPASLADLRDAYGDKLTQKESI